MKHYEVIGTDEFDAGGWHEPPEPYYPYVVVEAANKREARRLAAQSPEFKEHVQDRRSSGRPPFGGMRVQEPVCEHGHCWACSDCETCLADDGECLGCDQPPGVRVSAPTYQHPIAGTRVAGDAEVVRVLRQVTLALAKRRDRG